MDSSVWITNGLMWLAVAASSVALWESRRKMLARPNGKAEFRSLVGLNVAVMIVATILTVFTVGYASDKALALAHNAADAAAAIN